MTRAREAARLIGNNTFRLDSNNAVGFNSTTPDAMFDINHGLTVAGVKHLYRHEYFYNILTLF
jgi:hypothetical protein